MYSISNWGSLATSLRTILPLQLPARFRSVKPARQLFKVSIIHVRKMNMAHLGPSSKASRPHTTLAQLEVGCYQLGYRYAGDMRTSYFVLFDMQKEHENLTLARSGSHCASAAFDTRLASTNDPTISCHHLRCDDIVPWLLHLGSSVLISS